MRAVTVSDNKRKIDEFCHTAAVLPAKPDGRDPSLFRRGDRLYDVFGIAARANRDKNIALASDRLNLPREDFFKPRSLPVAVKVEISVVKARRGARAGRS